MARRRWLTVQAGLGVLAVLAVGASLWSLRYFRRYQPFADLAGGGGGLSGFELVVQDATITARTHDSARSRRAWRITAGTIALSRDRRQVRVTDIRRGILYDAHERPLIAVSAGAATYAAPAGVLGAAPSGQLQLTNGIRAAALGPRHLSVQTQTVIWNALTGQAEAPGPVVAVWDRPPLPSGAHIPRIVLQADGLRWDVPRQTVRSVGAVRAQFGPAARAAGTGAVLDLRTGNLSLSHLTGTFRVPEAVQ